MSWLNSTKTCMKLKKMTVKKEQNRALKTTEEYLINSIPSQNFQNLRSKMIGGDFNAELGPGEGIELSSVGHYTLNKANCRGEWMTQWHIDNSFCCIEHDVQENTEETSNVPHSKKLRSSWTTFWQTESIILGAEMRKPTTQYTWVVTTDVLWTSSKFRRTKANLVTPRRQSVNETTKRAKMETSKSTETLIKKS